MTSTPFDHPSPPGHGASEAEWISWVGATSTFDRMRLACEHIDSTEAEFTLAGNVFAREVADAARPGLVAAAADMAMGALAARAAPPGMLSATGTLHVQFLGPAQYPVRINVRMVPGDGRGRSVLAEAAGADGTRCLSGAATMIVGAGGRRTATEAN